MFLDSRKRKLFLLITLGALISVIGNTQSTSYKQVPIASPTAASLGKYADIPVSNHTGLPQVSIPVYTVQEGNLNIPVSLSYHAGGLKVMESASWVGAGWTLNAGGVITRTVQGQPDERLTSSSFSEQSKGHLSDNGYNNYLWQNLNDQGTVYLKDIYSGMADGEPDLFFFNFAGYTGKFYFGDDKVPVVMPEQDFKIEYIYTPGIFKSIESFIITPSNGTKYYFGITPSTTDTDPIERSLSISNTNGYANNGRSISSWYLNKIQSADGLHTINLTYQPESYSYFNIGSGQLDEPENVQSGSDLYKVVVEGVRLSNISYPNGSVDFITETQPRQDLSGTMWSVSDDANTQAKALKEIKVNDATGNCRKHTFSYDYFTDNVSSQPLGSTIQSDKKRLKLLSVKQESCDLSVSVPPYTFEYYDELVPRKISYAQDHWGFYNGANNLTTLIPAYRKYTLAGIEDIAGANRDSKWPEMRGGSLKKINYPTGGSAEFEFESNTSWVSYPSYNKVSRLYFSMGYDGNNTPVTQSYTFTNNPYRITLTNTAQGGYAAVTFGCTANQMYASTGQTTVFNNYFPAGLCNITLHKPDPMTGYGAGVLIEEMVPYQEQKNETIGGLRIKKVTSTAGAGMTPVATDYNYNLGDGHSSGILYSKPTYVQVLKNTGFRYTYQTLFYAGATWYLDAETFDANTWPYFTAGGRSAIKSASPILPMSTTQGNHIGYNEVKISQTGNGYSLYRYYGSNSWDFDIRDVCTRVLDLRSPNPPAPEYPAAPESFDYKRGELKYESHIDQSNRLLKESWYYPVFQNSQVTTPGIRVYSINAGPPLYMVTSARTMYDLFSAKKTEMSATERTFDSGTGGYIETASTQLFESPFHSEVTSGRVTNSKNEELVSKTKYAFEFKGAGCATTNTCWTGYQTTLQNNITLYNSEYNLCTNDDCRAVAKGRFLWRNVQARRDYATCRAQSITTYSNCFQTAKASANTDLKPIFELEDKFINAPIESTEWRDGKLAKAVFNKYDYATNPVGFAYPYKLQSIDLGSGSLSPTFTQAVVNGNSLTKDTRYTDEATVKYDNGNMVEVTTKDGVTTSYIWAYNNNLPVVKATGVNYTILKTAYDAVGGNLLLLRSQSSLSNAFINTYVYTPGVGMTSETDPRGRNIYYEYDKMNRLFLIRDHDNNILKKICYNYAGQAESCPITNSTIANWWTTGKTRCKPCPANNNYITNILQQEEKDINPQSATYNTIRWTDIGISTTCDVNADWQNTVTPVRCKKNASNQNTGEQEQEQSDVNPCSSSWGQIRWVVTGVNYTLCPPPVTCNSGNCTGASKKCVNNICETGTKFYTASVYNSGTGLWTCTYHYHWSDGSNSPDYTETSTTNCLGSSTD
jgi:hypothetical protein